MSRFLAAFAVAVIAASCSRTSSIAPAGSERRLVGDATRQRIDSTLRSFVESGRVAGISALVWEKGSEAYFGAFGYADREARRPMGRDAIVPLWFHPGEKWEYGPSVDIQALLVERLSGQPFAQYLRQHVLDPLRMRDTRYVVPAADLPRFAAMYVRGDSGRLTRVPDEQA